MVIFVMFFARQFALSAKDQDRHKSSIDYLLLEKEGGNHPRWFTHLLYADLIAASMLRAFEHCESDVLPPSHRKRTDMKFDVLPGISDPRTCKLNGRLLLESSAEGAINSTSIPFLGSLTAVTSTDSNVAGRIYATPAGSWGVADDGGLRLGWISCAGLNESTIAHLLPRLCPKPPENQQLLPSSLVFELSDSAATALNKADAAYLLQVKYLRTYTDFVGSVDVYFCNRKVGRLESRWDAEHMAHFSIPETFHYEYKTYGVENYWCLASAQKVTVEFRSAASGRFKILSVSMCEQDQISLDSSAPFPMTSYQTRDVWLLLDSFSILNKLDVRLFGTLFQMIAFVIILVFWVGWHLYAHYGAVLTLTTRIESKGSV